MRRKVEKWCTEHVVVSRCDIMQMRESWFLFLHVFDGPYSRAVLASIALNTIDACEASQGTKAFDLKTMKLVSSSQWLCFIFLLDTSVSSFLRNFSRQSQRICGLMGSTSQNLRKWFRTASSYAITVHRFIHERKREIKQMKTFLFI